LKDDNRILRSAPVIAKVLGVSVRTVARLVEPGVLKAQKLNGRTSPLIASRKHLKEPRTMRVSADPVNEPRLV
jgi:hypothetical protein